MLIVEPTADRFLASHTLDAVAPFVPDLTRRRLDAGHWAPRTEPALIARWIIAACRPRRGGHARDRRRGPSRPGAAAARQAGADHRRRERHRPRDRYRFARAGADLILVDRDLDAARATAGRLLDEPVSAEAQVLRRR